MRSLISNDGSPQKVGILGGTFNPLHAGHLLIAQVALSQGHLDRVIWVPTYHPPHKADQLIAFEHRMTMVQQAIALHPQFAASDVEYQRGGTSYAIATLNDLASLHPHTAWYWIIGLDAFQSLPRWRNSLELASQCHWLIAPRKTKNSQTRIQSVIQYFEARSVPLHWQLLTMPPIEISSSQIRQAFQQHRIADPTHSTALSQIPVSIHDYILSHALYQSGV